MRPSLIFLGGFCAYMLANAALPFRITHTLTDACTWAEAAPWGKLGLARGQPDADDNMARAVCFYRKGAKTDSLDIYRVLRRWPDKAHLTSLEMQHRDDLRLPAEENPADLQGLARR